MLAWVVLTYLIAAVPFGLVLTTLYGGEVDIRTAGSGNVGATNVARLYGWKLGLASLGLDIGKGALFTAGARLLWPEMGLWWPAVVAAVAFLAHCFSVYLEFRGGKGVATGAGGMLAISPLPTLLAVVVWGVILRVTGRSSVAALTASVSLVGWCLLLDPRATWVVVFLALGIAYTHTSNIRRLMAGEETQVVRPVRWGRKKQVGAAELLEQGPAGRNDAPPVWRETARDPLEPTEDVVLEG
ncbi:MAG: glycerol-3-phosphate 1-O-acyltransferase PlsY [Myxococcales bacterium]|nr:glycerol-3-phosphate 1-O-acyltransferase PlsY [Myxococcales bacterium]